MMGDFFFGGGGEGGGVHLTHYCAAQFVYVLRQVGRGLREDDLCEILNFIAHCPASVI